MKSSDTPISQVSTNNQLQNFTFSLLLGGFEELTQEIEDALYEAGCDDAILGVHCGKPYLEFDREAPTLKDAILSAIRDVLGTKNGIAILKIQPPGMDIIEMVNEILKLREESKSNRPLFDDAWQLLIKED